MQKSIILGTDWWTDCDDAVALRLICRFVKEGRVNLLGIGINACMEHSAASVKGFLAAEGMPNIHVGIDAKATDFGGTPRYQERLAKAYCQNVKNEDLPSALRLYRRLLAESADKTELVEIGYPQVLADLIESKADDISEMNGMELVRAKVSKLWVMAGKWDGDGEKENNFCRNPRSRLAAESRSSVKLSSLPAGISVMTRFRG